MLNEWDTNTTLNKNLLHELELYLMLFFLFPWLVKCYPFVGMHSYGNTLEFIVLMDTETLMRIVYNDFLFVPDSATTTIWGSNSPQH